MGRFRTGSVNLAAYLLFMEPEREIILEASDPSNVQFSFKRDKTLAFDFERYKSGDAFKRLLETRLRVARMVWTARHSQKGGDDA